MICILSPLAINSAIGGVQINAVGHNIAVRFLADIALGARGIDLY